MKEFDELVEIMARLRSAEGCPWDREQTIPLLGPYLLEEAYEVLEAVDGGEPLKLCAELGDLMLLVVFYAQIATEQGQFGISQSLQRINDKLRFRHPHVFGDVQVSGPDEVVVNWEQLKRQEPETGRRESALDGVPRALPALQRAFDMQKRAARVGFDWPSPEGAREKVAEEFGELQQAEAEGGRAELEHELGDLLFAAVNYGRLLGMSAEEALRQASNRFEQRFRRVEQKAAERGLALPEMTLAQMDELWEEAKAEELSHHPPSSEGQGG